MARQFTVSAAGALVFFLISTLLVKESQADYTPTLVAKTGSPTATGSELTLSSADSTIAITAVTLAVGACTPDCPAAPTAVPDGNDMTVTLTSLVPATHYAVSFATGELTASTVGDATDTKTASAAADADVCTKPASLAFTIGTANGTAIPVSWTVPTAATAGALPTEYKLYVGTTLVKTIMAADVGDGEFVFTASDAAGTTALEAGTDYMCKLAVTIADFGSGACPGTDAAAAVEETKECKLASGAAVIVSNVALLGLVVMRIFA